MNYNFHSSPEENPNRLLNVLLRGTYVRPHRHLNPPKAESFIVLEGKAVLFIFDGDGTVLSHYLLGGATPGADLSPGVWHTITALSEHAICFEVKPGPYSAHNDKEFAQWAPPEGGVEAQEYLNNLLRIVTGARS